MKLGHGLSLRSYKEELGTGIVSLRQGYCKQARELGRAPHFSTEDSGIILKACGSILKAWPLVGFGHRNEMIRMILEKVPSGGSVGEWIRG